MNRWLLGLLIVGGGFGLLLLIGVGFVGLRVYSLWNAPDAQFNRHNVRGDNFYYNHQFRQAEEEYRAMIALRPDRARGYYLHGAVECDLKNYGQGIRDAQTALRLATLPGTRAECYEHLGDCYRGMQNWKKALANYDEAQQRDDNNLSLYVSRAACYNTLKQYKRAARDYAVCVNLFPVQPYYYQMYAEALAKAGDVNEAVKADLNTVDRFPRDADTWGDLGWHQYLAGKLPDAVRSDKKGLALKGNMIYVRCNLALCYAALNQAGAARKEYAAAKRAASATELKSAIEDLQTALKKQPGSALIKQSLEFLQAPAANQPATKTAPPRPTQAAPTQ